MWNDVLCLWGFHKVQVTLFNCMQSHVIYDISSLLSHSDLIFTISIHRHGISVLETALWANFLRNLLLPPHVLWIHLCGPSRPTCRTLAARESWHRVPSFPTCRTGRPRRMRVEWSIDYSPHPSALWLGAQMLNQTPWIQTQLHHVPAQWPWARHRAPCVSVSSSIKWG